MVDPTNSPQSGSIPSSIFGGTPVGLTSPWLCWTSILELELYWFGLAFVEFCLLSENWLEGVDIDVPIWSALVEFCRGDALALLALSLCAEWTECCDDARGDMRPFCDVC